MLHGIRRGELMKKLKSECQLDEPGNRRVEEAKREKSESSESKRENSTFNFFPEKKVKYFTCC